MFEVEGKAVTVNPWKRKRKIQALFFCLKRDYLKKKRDYLAKCRDDKTRDWVSNPPEMVKVEMAFSGDVFGTAFWFTS